ncbi:AAA domain-containing protein [Litorihabitans aurantiacus]|uniref:Uncharacterized protein n=1 Tax=Litorihabitans aurantiacus TaxID=1930061 RepID=A0AA38CUG5_9MICO|nr:AAA domain-containing protein [Litorihabitans aurantiacus]GMA33356.1 hypothetical protein GCM10025875_33480 [Litorihabitans aurantiacus]
MGARGRSGVAEITDEGGTGPEAFRAGLVPAREATSAAIASAADVVFQATFFDGRFYGRADFLLKERGGDPADGPVYAVVDTKLTNKVRATALLQMAAYADQLLAAGVAVADRVTVHHGNGERSDQPLADLLAVYRGERRLVEALLDAHLASGAAADWEDWRDPSGVPALLAALPPDLAPARRACGRCDHCANEVARTRDVQLVHGIRAVQRTRLYGEGVRSLTDLAALAHPVPRMNPVIQERLTRQARLQVGQLDRIDRAEAAGFAVGPGMLLTEPDGAAPAGDRAEVAAAIGDVVAVEVVGAALLRSLPPPSTGDIYFDFEGDPMWSTSGGMEGGLEYLFGLVEESDDEPYVAFWAHDRAQEKAALVDFLDYVRRRRARYPDMHIYHYANYERAALERLAERHGAGLEAVLTLVREGVLVDLFPVVRGGVAVSQASYSIKKLEPLYMGGELRDTSGVTTGGDSVAQYAAGVAAGAAGDAATFDAVMADIADYNRYDCVSTRRLVQWLRSLAHGRHAGGDGVDVEVLPPIAPVAPVAPVLDGGGDGAARDTFAPTPVQRLVGLLRDVAGPAPRADADTDALALLAAALDYHRREDAPVWRAHFERLTHPIDWWADTRDVLVVDDTPVGCEVLEDWSGGGRSRRRVLRLEGLLGAGSTPAGMRDGFAVYPLSESDGLRRDPGAAWATTSLTMLDVAVSRDGTRASWTVRESAPADFAELGAGAAGAVPSAVVPGPPIRTTSIHLALVELAARVIGTDLATLERLGDDAPPPVRAEVLYRLRGLRLPALEILRRTLPRLRQPNSADGPDGPDGAAPDDVHRCIHLGPLPDLDDGSTGDPLPPVVGGDHVAAVTAATAALEHSVLGVQGPPGTGKTYVGARVIARLVSELGWRVGVVAQSHAVVEHLLDEIVGAGLPGSRVGKTRRDAPAEGAEPPPWTELRKDDHAEFLAEHAAGGCVIGGTVWDMTNRKRIGEGQLDLLVVDEAGQFALANTVAAATAAQRVLLLGDPQQLPQVTQGSHDEPVDTSALAWIAGGAATVPAERGYFLERTWRMHPALCAAVSDLSYDGRLQPNAEVTGRRHLEGVAPGLHRVLEPHRGNSSASPEEAAAVVRLVRSLLGRPWRSGDAGAAATSPLATSEILVVAAYNAQVNLVRAELDAVGLTEVRVGTVDKFQGQEAAVAIVTLAASSSRDAPRGADFLINRNRLNVAISRAQWAAYVVHAPGLDDALPHGGQALADLGAFRRLTAAAASPTLRESFTDPPRELS